MASKEQSNKGLVSHAVGNIDSIIKAINVPTELKVDQKNYEAVCMMACHCVINGPVGVNKTTTFPGLGSGEKKIKDYAGCTNRTWQAFCLQVATAINKAGKAPKDCYTVQSNGDLWPIADFPEKP